MKKQIVAGRTLVYCTNLDTLGQSAAEWSQRILSACVGASTACFVALSGGKTPQSLYRHLSQTPLVQSIPWGNLQIYFSDERVVPLSHSDSNYHFAMNNLLSKVPIRTDQIHPMLTDVNSPQQQAQIYTDLLTRQLPQRHGVPCFDLIILGMGQDGHTASLFPNSTLLAEREKPVVAGFVDSVSAWRISLTLPVLNAARNVIILVSGADKAETLKKIFYEPNTHFPIQQLNIRDEVIWFIDEAGAIYLR